MEVHLDMYGFVLMDKLGFYFGLYSLDDFLDVYFGLYGFNDTNKMSLIVFNDTNKMSQ
jgi:hypothetical protein